MIHDWQRENQILGAIFLLLLLTALAFMVWQITWLLIASAIITMVFILATLLLSD